MTEKQFIPTARAVMKRKNKANSYFLVNKNETFKYKLIQKIGIVELF